MNNQKNAGFTTTAIIGGVLVVVLLAAGGWYVTRQQSTVNVDNEVGMVPNASPGMDTEEGTGISPIQSHRSFAVQSDASTKSYQPKTPSTYTFSIVDDQGTTVKDFATVHEKIMHVIVVRKDLQDFQHVHPDFNKTTGKFTLSNLAFSSDGPYRIFADFTPMSAQRGLDGQPLGVTLSEDVTVGNLANYKPHPLVTSQLTQSFQGYTVQLISTPTPITAETSTTLSFDIKQNGGLVTNLEKYLGALGHTVVLREGDLEFLHTHALDDNVANQTGKVDFAVTFPTAGTYKIFSQLQHQGKVITTNFVITAESKSAGANEGNEPPIQGEHGLPNTQH